MEKVVSEGVRDDFKTMTDIYGRLCSYLDGAASSPSPRGSGTGAPSLTPTTAINDEDGGNGDGKTSGAISDGSVLPTVSTLSSVEGASQGGVLSTFVAPMAEAVVAVEAPEMAAGGGGEEGLEGVMNDLEVKGMKYGLVIWGSVMMTDCRTFFSGSTCCVAQ